MTHTRDPLKRVGHKGADLIEPGNTAASFDAALAHGVDMIELDVLPERWSKSRPGGRLMLAHDYDDLARREPLTLEEGLAHLASDAFSELDFIVDVKLPGYESQVVEALARSGLSGRTLVSTTYRSSLAELRQVDGDLRLAWSVPRAKRDYTRSPLLAVPALVALAVIKRVLPARASAAIRGRLCDAIMAHWRLASPALVRAVTAAGGDLFVWTVDHAERIRELEQLGVTGVITNDPRLFDPA
jgi:glycerophosphoryl diester phosphodiesterase